MSCFLPLIKTNFIIMKISKTARVILKSGLADLDFFFTNISPDNSKIGQFKHNMIEKVVI